MGFSTTLPAHAQERTATYDIEGQRLADALIQYGRISGMQIIFSPEVVGERQAPALHGEHSSSAALSQLLSGSGLRAERVAGGAIQIVDESARPQRQAAAQETDSRDSDEIVVTGTLIRGAPPAAPVHTVTRDDIERSGYSQIGDVMRALPENYGGGQNPTVLGTASSDNFNVTNSSTMNLRGLGSGATLVLLNGRRMAGDSVLAAPDISVIPLGAIQRVEVVTDGASGIYGSDAIAGVANFILRRDFEGGEISARVGDTTQGGGFEQTYSVLGGLTGDNWYATLSAEYGNQEPIRANQRDFTRTAEPGNNLIREIERTSVYLGLGIDLTDRLSASFDALLSQRDTSTVIKYRPSSLRLENVVTTPSQNYAAGLEYELSDTWNIRLDAVYSHSVNEMWQRTPSATTNSEYENETSYVEARADGTAFRLPSGDVRLALGAGYREEDFVGTSTGTIAGREINYAFGEVLVPFVEPSSNRLGLQELDLSLSARVEEYSDFGTASNLKVGLRYVPFDDVTLRGTWGTSFRAPTLFHLAVNTYSIYQPAAVFGGAVGDYVLFLSGGNTNLAPEEADTWTIGADWTPSALGSFRASLTYFNVAYEGRIGIGPNLATALSNPIYAPFVTVPSSVAEVNDIIDQTNEFRNLTGIAFAPEDVNFIVDGRYTNISTQQSEGIDLTLNQTFEVGAGRLNAFANFSWLRTDQQTLPTTPSFELTGTAFNAPDFRARAGATWYNDGFSATGIVNYVGSSYESVAVTPRDISSWTTFDVTLAYEFQQEDGPFSGVRLALSAQNILDKDPPLARSTAVSYTGIYFDSTNTNPIGRFVALQLSKRF